MDESDKTAHIAQFAAITGVDTERAQFYLESATWNLELAISSFYHEDESPGMDTAQAATASGPPVEALETGPIAVKKGKKAKGPPPAPSRFGTISGLKIDSDSDSSEEGEAYYAGGSEQGGGQQIIGPPKKKPGKLVEEMFEAAKEHGAEEVTAGTENPKASKSSTFYGSGYRLGDTEQVSSDVIQGAAKMEQPRDVTMILKLWKTGFSINDGQLRDYHDPANQEFLSAIKKGEVPRELVREAHGGEVSLDMEDHRTEDFVAPKPTIKPFAGEGHRLGSAAPTVVSSPSQIAAGESAAKSQLPVDDSKPTTTVQIRLADNTRLIVKLNLSHTVGDIRNYILVARPQHAEANFALMTTFPSKELTELSQTVEEGKLLNAVIVQRMK